MIRIHKLPLLLSLLNFKMLSMFPRADRDPRQPRDDRLGTNNFHREQNNFYMKVRALIKKRGTIINFLSTVSLVLIGMSTLTLTGCASVFSVSEYPVHLDSVPSDMEIVVTDRNGNIEYRGQTPAIVDLDARGGYFVRETFTVELYDAGKVVGRTQIKGGIDLWYFVNFISRPWTTLVGFFVIDPITGAMWSLDKSVTVFRDVKTTGTISSAQQQIDDVEDTSETNQDDLVAQKSDVDSTPVSEETK